MLHIPSSALPSIARCVLRDALTKLDDCREACPGVGGDVDAKNLRHMIETAVDPEAARQAADRLASLSNALEINAAEQVEALRVIADLFDCAG